MASDCTEVKISGEAGKGFNPLIGLLWLLTPTLSRAILQVALFQSLNRASMASDLMNKRALAGEPLGFQSLNRASMASD